MNSNEMEQDKIKKTKSRKYIITAIVILLLVTSVLALFVFTQTQKPDPASEAIIREAAAAQLGKEPIELTDKDFATIMKLDLSGKKVYDIKLLEKFENLEELHLGRIPLPKPTIPKWMSILGKLPSIDLYKIYSRSYKKKYFLDLSPLEKLSNLKILFLDNTAMKGLEPLANIENLQEINMTMGQLVEYGFSQDETYTIVRDASIFINKKEFKINPGDFNSNNSQKPIPEIKLELPGGQNAAPIKHAEERIQVEIDKILK